MAMDSSKKTVTIRILRKRHRKVCRDSIVGISDADCRHLARRGGITTLAAPAYISARAALQCRLREILAGVVKILDHSDRKICTVEDIIFVLNRMGWTIYGFHGA